MRESIWKWFVQFVISKLMGTSKKDQNNQTKIVQKATGRDITQIGIQNNYNGKEGKI